MLFHKYLGITSIRSYIQSVSQERVPRVCERIIIRFKKKSVLPKSTFYGLLRNYLLYGPVSVVVGNHLTPFRHAFNQLFACSQDKDHISGISRDACAGQCKRYYALLSFRRRAKTAKNTVL